MIRLNGSTFADAAVEPFLERAVVEQPGQVVGSGADLDGLEDLGVLERDRDLRGEQLDELELLGRERVRLAQPLDRQHADGAAAAAQRDDDEAALDRAELVAEVVDPRIGLLVADEDRLVVLEHPGRHPGLTRRPGFEIVRGVDAAGGQRRQQAARRVDDLDGDVVGRDEPAESFGDALQHARARRGWSGRIR